MCVCVFFYIVKVRCKFLCKTLDTAYSSFWIRRINFSKTNTAYSTLTPIRRIQFFEYGVLIYLTFSSVYVANLLLEMDDRDMTMEEYVQYETKKALRNGEMYNWETVTYGKIWYDKYVHYLRLFETEFPAIVYNDALASKSDFSSEPTVSPQHMDEVNLKNETSLSEYDDEKYNVISYNDLLPFNIISVND